MLTFPSALDRTNRLFADNVAVIDYEGRLTWAEFFDRIRRAGGLLKNLGLKPGQRFGILSRNSFRQQELLYGAYWVGAIPVPINFRLAAKEIAFILEDAECGPVFIEDALIDFAETEELAPWRDNVIQICNGESDSNRPQYEKLLNEAEPAEPADIGEEDDAILLYTGGTTGRSKGVRLSHANCLANALQLAHAMRTREDDVFLHVSPMFHSADLIGSAFTVVGAAHSFLPEFAPQAMLSAIQDYGVTQSMLAPTVIILTLQDETFEKYDTSSMRNLFYGSAPMAAEWVKRTMEGFPSAGLQQGYGLTETSPILTTMEPEYHEAAIDTGDLGRLKSCGRPVIGLDLKVVDEKGRELAQGEVGEVVVRGPQVTKGYLNRPEETERAFRDGWFHTGDMGRLDEDGFLYLMDRKKDMIITGGENVYSTEVESALYKHPAVLECAVFGVPDAKWGEAVSAAIVAEKDADLTEEKLIEHCREWIGGYKIPRKLFFVDELPKTAVGKVQKKELRKMFGQDE